MKKSILNTVIVMLLFVAFLSGSLLLWYTYRRSCEKDSVEALKSQAFAQIQEQTKPTVITKEPLPIANDTILANLKVLQLQNEDLAAWIHIEGTQIDYPVMYTPTKPQYYLRRDFDKNDSLAGLPFMQETCSIMPQSDNIIVYGHDMKDGSMFSQLHRYSDEAFWKEWQTIDFYTTAEKQTYQIIAVIETMVNTENAFEYISFVEADSKETFDRFITEAKNYSLYDTGIEAIYGNHLLTLSTCSDKGQDSRLVVIAKQMTQ